MRMSRAWAMPSSATFSVPPIKELIERWRAGGDVVVDPFAGTSELGTIRNDLDPSKPTQYHMDATEFLAGLPDGCADLVLYDPPYSPRQVSECYRRLGMTVDMQTTQASYWSRQKREIARICRPGGHVITCSWNSGGIGKGNGFELVEVLLVAHGGWHNDTIVTVDERVG